MSDIAEHVHDMDDRAIEMKDTYTREHSIGRENKTKRANGEAILVNFDENEALQ